MKKALNYLTNIFNTFKISPNLITCCCCGLCLCVFVYFNSAFFGDYVTDKFILLKKAFYIFQFSFFREMDLNDNDWPPFLQQVLSLLFGYLCQCDQIKIAKCLKKLPKNDITRKMLDFDTFTKIA